MNLAALEHQIISEYLGIHVHQITSDNLVIKKLQIASDQGDACPHHLAMLVTSYCCHQAYGKRTHVINSTPTIESHFKTKYMVKTWL